MALEIEYDAIFDLVTRDNWNNKFRKRTINGEPVQSIIPIGNNCTLAFLLKRNGLKRASFPFDWNFSTPESIIHCLEDNFSSYLNKSYFAPKTNSDGLKAADNLFYKENFGILDFYTHRDPSIKENYDYFCRTIDRFYACVKSGSTKLFVSMSRPHVDAISTFDKTHNALSRLTKNFNYLSIQLVKSNENIGDLSIKKLKDNGVSRLYQFKPQFSEENSFEFPCFSDELIVSSLICEYDFSLR